MSYDVRLKDAETGETLDAGEVFQEGGTQAVGGTSECDLNITYNYAEVFGGLVSDLDGEPANGTLPRLREFVAKWGHLRPYERDYWAPTPGNAVAAIKRLLMFAERHPNGIWEVR